MEEMDSTEQQRTSHIWQESPQCSLELRSSVHPPPGHGQVHHSMGREAVTHLDNRH